MTNEIKELITLAAKAMGYVIESIDGDVCFRYNKFPDPEESYGLTKWNPYISDSDCFRMETELEIDVLFFKRGERVEANNGLPEDHRDFISWTNEYGTDKAAARRLASLRVAAEIGRRME